jgi:type II secretory pathway component PulF
MAKDKKPTSATFNWKDKDNKGNRTEGTIKADTAEQAKAKLYSQGIVVSEIKKRIQPF